MVAQVLQGLARDQEMCLDELQDGKPGQGEEGCWQTLEALQAQIMTGLSSPAGTAVLASLQRLVVQEAAGRVQHQREERNQRIAERITKKNAQVAASGARTSSGAWTTTRNARVMQEMGANRAGHVSMQAFVQYLSGKLPPRELQGRCLNKDAITNASCLTCSEGVRDTPDGRG